MVLNSQAPRSDSPGKGRYHAAYSRSRRGGGGKTGILLFILLLVGGYAFYHFIWQTKAKAATTSQAPTTPPPDRGSSPPAVLRQLTPEPPKTPPKSDPSVAVGRGTGVDALPQPPKPTPKAEEPPKPAPKPPATTATLPAADPQIAQILAAADQAAAAGQLLAARDQLNRLHATRSKLTGADAAKVRAAIAKINQILVFSPAVTEGDPLAVGYAFQDGDRLSSLGPRNSIPWQFIQRINNVDPGRIQIGQKLKLIKGPFHVVVTKSEFRLDIYLGDPTKPGSTYIRGFDVGLGTNDSTPVGRFIVKRGGKAENPSWDNPRNPGEHYAKGDPKNPIGQRWIGLRGLDEATQSFKSYGIHGTIDPSSIGKQMSMGCVRMRDDDVKLVYDMLVEEKSTITIQE